MADIWMSRKEIHLGKNYCFDKKDSLDDFTERKDLYYWKSWDPQPGYNPLDHQHSFSNGWE